MQFEYWLLIALILCVAEIVAPGSFLIFVAAGAAIAGFAAAFTSSLMVQLGVFAGGIVSAVLFGTSLYRTVVYSRVENGLAQGPIGESGIVEEAIKSGNGKVRVRDISWLAAGPDMLIGTRIIVIGRNGTRLYVEPTEEQPGRTPSGPPWPAA